MKRVILLILSVLAFGCAHDVSNKAIPPPPNPLGKSGDALTTRGKDFVVGDSVPSSYKAILYGDGTLWLDEYTVATLPSTYDSDDAGRIALVNDGDDATDCTTGGGSDNVICRWNGSAWENAGDGTAAGSAEVQDEAYSEGAFNGDTTHAPSQDAVYDKIEALDAAKLDTQTVGIADDNLVEMDDADAEDDDVAIFTENGLEGHSIQEFVNILTGATIDWDTSNVNSWNGGSPIYQDGYGPSFGTGEDWDQYWDATLESFLFTTTLYNGSADNVGMYLIRVNDGGGTLDADQLVFEIRNNATSLFSVDEDGDLAFSGDLPDDKVDSGQIVDGSVDPVHLANTVRSEFVPIGWFNDGTSAPAAIADEDNTSYRDFASDGTEDIECNWMVSSNLTGSTIKVRPIAIVTNATAPADTEGVSWEISACSNGTNDDHDCTLGTPVYSEDTDLDDDAGAQWDLIFFPYIEVTPTGLAAGELLKLSVARDHDNTDDDYGQDIGLIGVEIKWQEDPGTMTY
jgi:hypothetical protein